MVFEKEPDNESLARLFPTHLLPHQPVDDLFVFHLQVFGFDTPEQVEKASDQTGPAGLVAGAEPGAVITVEVFVEKDQIAPVRILLKLACAAVDRPPVISIA